MRCSTLRRFMPPTSSRPTVALLLAVTGCAVLSVDKGEQAQGDIYRHPPAMMIPTDKPDDIRADHVGQGVCSSIPGFQDHNGSAVRLAIIQVWAGQMHCRQEQGVGMRKLKRSTPTLINIGYNRTLQWDGRDEVFRTTRRSYFFQNKKRDGYGHADNIGAAVHHKGLSRYVRARLSRRRPSPRRASRRLWPSLSAPLSRSTPRSIVGAVAITAPSASRPSAASRYFGAKVTAPCATTVSNFTDDGFPQYRARDAAGNAGRRRSLLRYAKSKSMKGAFKTPTFA